MSNVHDFSTGEITKSILKFYFPLFLTNMLQQFYTFVDTAIVGNGLGDNALASVGNMSSLSFLIIGFSFGLSIGFSVLVAQYFGAKDYNNLKKSLAASIKLAVIITIVLSVLSNFYLRDALLFLQTDIKILPDGLIYGHIIFAGMFTSVGYNFSAAVLRAFGDSRTPLTAIITSSIINIILDLFFIYVFHTGVEGAAIATVISQGISAFICINRIRGIQYAKLKREDFKNSISMYFNLLKNGVGMAIMNSITAIGCMTVQYFVNGSGLVATAAYSACGKYINLFMNPSFTAGHAMSAFTSQNFGARRFDRIKKGLAVCLSISIISYVVLGLFIMHVFPVQLADIFLDSGASIKLTANYLRICGYAIIAVDLMFVFRSAVQAMGYPLVPVISGVAEMVLRMGVIILLFEKIGFNATAYAEAFAWSGALLLNLVAFFAYMHGNMKIVNNN